MKNSNLHSKKGWALPDPLFIIVAIAACAFLVCVWKGLIVDAKMRASPYYREVQERVETLQYRQNQLKLAIEIDKGTIWVKDCSGDPVSEQHKANQAFETLRALVEKMKDRGIPVPSKAERMLKQGPLRLVTPATPAGVDGGS